MSWKNDQVSKKETTLILEAAELALDRADGDFVEFGCYRGDTSLLLAGLLQHFNAEKELKGAQKRRLWLYDSFEGLPEKTAPDITPKSPEFVQGALSTSKRAVKLRFLHANLPVPIIKKAWFNELTSGDLPEKISFAFLDGDFYDSIKTSLELVFPRLASDGIVVVHDYKNDKLPGVRQATDEFFAKNNLIKKQNLILI